MKLSKTLFFASIFSTITLSVSAHESSSISAQQTTLKQVMRGLLNDSQEMSEAIFLRNFEQIKKAAIKIANHPAPAMEIRRKLAKNLGAEMDVFKSFDMKVHNAAVVIAKAASEKNMKLVVTEYHQLVDGCQSCHSNFKQRISKIFLDK